MPIKKTLPKRPIPDEDVHQWLFENGRKPFFYDDDELQAFWEAYRDEVFKAWILEYPCTRPQRWWEHEAPKEPVEGWDDERWHSAQRIRLGGIGTEEYLVLNVAPHFDKGIPVTWVMQQQVDFYNGRLKDVHGKHIGTEYKEGHFSGVAIDHDDPPRFESEAAYLQRHELLTETEKKYLEKHPECLEPERVAVDDDDEQ